MGEDSDTAFPVGPVTRTELTAFQGRIDERLEELLSLARTGQLGNGTPTAEKWHSMAATQATRRGAFGNGGAPPDPKRNEENGSGGGVTSGEARRAAGRPRKACAGAERRTNEDGADGYTDGEQSSERDSLLGGLGGGEAERFITEHTRAARRGAIVHHPDGFDDPELPAADETICAYDIPPGVRRADGFSVPFEPADARFLPRLKDGSPQFHEASFAYQVAAWTQELSSAAVTFYHERDTYSAQGLADRLAGAAVASRPLFHLATAQYDYLESKQRDPVGAELYRSTEAEPRNTLRGPKGRRWLSTVARDEVKINSKTAAEERANKHGRRKNNPGGSNNTDATATPGGRAKRLTKA